MAALTPEVVEVVGEFQRYVKNRSRGKIESYSLEDLNHINMMLGERDFNADYRMAIRSRISELQALSERNYQTKVRRAGHLISFVLGVLMTLVAQWFVN